MKSIRIFLISLTLTFLMVAIPRLYVRRLPASSLPKAPDILEKVRPQLENKPPSFSLRKELIPSISAGSDYEQASAYGVVDLNTGEVLLSKNFSDKLPIASLTKIMTAVVALDLAGPDEKFTVSQKAASEIPSKVMLKPGEKFFLSTLLDSMLISSANDSAETISEGIDAKFGQDVFVKAMNLKAKFLGLKNTHFTNAEGYDNPYQFGSVEDLTLLSSYALKNYPQITQIVSEEFKDLTNGGQDQRFYLNNWNGLLGVYPGVSGVKIGNTEKAGYCTIVFSQREGRKLLAVVLGAPGILERDLWASQLLDLGFQKTAGLLPVNITKVELQQKYSSWKYFN